MLGVTIATAQAQYRDYDYRGGNDHQENWSRERTRDYALKLGYHQAYSEAGTARERGFRGSFRDMPGYRADTNGFLTWMNYREDYRDAYRSGYESGFRDAFAGRERRYGRADVERVLGDSLKNVYPDDDRDDWRRGGRDDYDYRNGRGDYGRGRDNDYRNGGRWDVRAIAQQNGYRDGIRRGEEDRWRRRGFDLQGSSEYRDALSGYRWEFGNRDRYRELYRDGFRRGYTEGFRRGDNRGRWPY